ncbi:DUF3043 domain-containing protein [Trueperella sp. LYQ143]|uniref:DUF3043 domain-containing protein n=1 Tax=unclassified Trueperella TaxID=2630174 RepID=UPI003982DD80
MFGFKKQTQSQQPHDSQQEAPLPKGYTPAKGAPTPRRKDVQAARRRPLIADTSSMSRSEKRAVRAEQRARSNELYHKQQEAMRTGDERNMPPQHQGRERAWARNYIDATGPYSSMFMPLALLLIPVMFLQYRWPRVFIPVIWVIYALFIAMMVYAVYLARKTKMLAEYHFGSLPRGFFMQMLGRCFYVRRWRLPVPQVKRGEFPKGSSRQDVKAARQARRNGRRGLGFFKRR